jgi:stearoyl-CoA desaturase (delta-9 desaturase)
VLFVGPYPYYNDAVAVINWFAHKYGSVNFKLNNTSRNLYPMDLLLMGEAYHNNHHKTPGAINFGKRWYEFDPTYPLIRFLGWVRIIKVNKVHKSSNVELEAVFIEPVS